VIIGVLGIGCGIRLLVLQAGTAVDSIAQRWVDLLADAARTIDPS